MKLSKVLIPFLFASTAVAQEVGESAVIECQRASHSFSTVVECLPHTQVAGELLAMVSQVEFYGAAGADLVSECSAINESAPGTWTCVGKVLGDAARLADMVGDPSKIEDPRLTGLAHPEKYERLRAHLRERMIAFRLPPRIEIPRETRFLK